MGLIPTTKTGQSWKVTAGDDFLQLLSLSGARVGWIDSSGIPQGALQTVIPTGINTVSCCLIKERYLTRSLRANGFKN